MFLRFYSPLRAKGFIRGPDLCYAQINNEADFTPKEIMFLQNWNRKLNEYCSFILKRPDISKGAIYYASCFIAIPK